MRTQNFHQLLEARWSLGAYLCIELGGKKRSLESMSNTIASNLNTVGATKSFANSYRLNIETFNLHDTEGLTALGCTIKDIRSIAPNVPIILEGCNCPETAFDLLQADAVIMNPFPGFEALTHFLLREDKGIFIRCHSFLGELQDMEIFLSDEEKELFFRKEATEETDEESEETWPEKIPIYEWIAHSATQHWNKNGNCGLVVNASDHNKLCKVRLIARNMPLLTTHLNSKEEEIRRTIDLGRNKQKRGIILATNIEPNLAEKTLSDTAKLHELVTKIINESSIF